MKINRCLNHIFSIILLLFFFIHHTHARYGESSVLITIKDHTDQVLAGATVHLTRVTDSVKVSQISDSQGIAKFTGLAADTYIVNATYIGFQPVEKTILVRGQKTEVNLLMNEDMVSLGEVTVSARKPLLKQEGDKLIVDPEPMASISTNTLEVLESTPGVFVDQDGGIFLSGTTPATVFINDREQKLGSRDINTILRSLPPGSVERIEIMRNPSARYSASSSGGIVNIVLKKGYKIGRFGSVTSGFNQGFYGNQFVSATLNNSGDNSTNYVNASINNNGSLEELNSDRFLTNGSVMGQGSRTRRSSLQGLIGYGWNFDVNDNLQFSYDGRVNGSLPSTATQNANLMFDETDNLVFASDNIVDNSTNFINVQQDFGLKRNLDTLGSAWDTQISYTYNYSDQAQDYRNTFQVPDPFTMSGGGVNLQRRHFLQAQTDLVYYLPHDFILETGLNSSFQLFESDADFNLVSDGVQVNDPLRSAEFNYRENINAAYLQFTKDLVWDVTLKTGVRMEHTFMEGNQLFPADTNFVVNRADWFPYVYLSKPVFDMGPVSLKAFLIYRRTIARPGYDNLNPAINYVDQFLYELGNPSLTPQFRNNIEANISFNDFPVFAVGRNYTNDIFSQVTYENPLDENILIRTFDNLGKNRETYFRALAGIPPGGTYFFAVGTQYNYNEYDGFYDDAPLSFNRGSWRFFTFHMLKLSKSTRFFVSGFMMTRGQMNFIELDTFGTLNLGLRQTFLNQRLTISLNARDILRTMVNDFQLNQGDVLVTGNRYTDNQRFGINIRYTFGIGQQRQQQQENPFNFEGMDE